MVNEYYGLNIRVINLNEKAGEEDGKLHTDNRTDSEQ